MDEIDEKFCPDFDQEFCSAFGGDIMSFTGLLWRGDRLFEEAMLSLEKDFDNTHISYFVILLSRIYVIKSHSKMDCEIFIIILLSYKLQNFF